jgi:hypothetical protein
LAETSRRLGSRQSGPPANRTLVTTAGTRGDAAAEAREIARTLRANGALVVLLDWDSGGTGIAARLGVSAAPGAMDLLVGQATFEDIITARGEDEPHVIACGTASPAALDPDRINLLLDALDEAYDHVVIHAERPEARKLFELIEGRIDVGVSVVEADMPRVEDGPGRFLGFRVTDMEIVLTERTGPAPPAEVTPRRHMQLARAAKTT